MPQWLRADGETVLIDLWVVPGASRTRVMGLRGDRIKLCVAAPAERGRANEALLAHLNESLAPGLVSLVSGASGRAKTVSVQGVTIEEIKARLAE